MPSSKGEVKTNWQRQDKTFSEPLKQRLRFSAHKHTCNTQTGTCILASGVRNATLLRATPHHGSPWQPVPPHRNICASGTGIYQQHLDATGQLFKRPTAPTVGGASGALEFWVWYCRTRGLRDLHNHFHLISKWAYNQHSTPQSALSFTGMRPTVSDVKSRHMHT